MSAIQKKLPLSKRLKWRARRLILPGAPYRGRLRPGSPIVVAGLLGTGSGIGESARLCVRSLEKLGYAPLAIDLSDTFGQREFESDAIVTQLPRAAGLLILHLNAPETERAIFELGLRRFHNWIIVGYWAWETTQVPSHWIGASKYLNEVWTPSKFVADAVRSTALCTVRVQPHIVPVPQQQNDSSTEIVTCLAMADGFSSLHRKNLLGAIRMFQKSKHHAPGAKLIVKTRNFSSSDEVASKIRTLIEQDEDIEHINSSMSKHQLNALIDHSDILLSPHRSEGFGLVLADAMLREKTVIATGWSGNMDFMTPETAMLIPFKLTPVTDPSGLYLSGQGAKWAEPDFEKGVELLTRAFRSNELRREIGTRAKKHVSSVLSHDTWKLRIESLQN